MREVDPLTTKRWRSWELYHQAPMPMVTIFQTLDITNLMRWQKRGYKMNMLLCYCIGKARHSAVRNSICCHRESGCLAYDQIESASSSQMRRMVSIPATFRLLTIWKHSTNDTCTGRKRYVRHAATSRQRTA